MSARAHAESTTKRQCGVGTVRVGADSLERVLVRLFADRIGGGLASSDVGPLGVGGHKGAMSAAASRRPVPITKARWKPIVAHRSSGCWSSRGAVAFPLRPAHTAIVTRRKVAGIEVASSLGLAFWALKSASNSACRSASRPLAAAASNAFMVGP